MSLVPLPWCTSQSRTNTRSAPSASSACRAATATLLNRQKPIARAGSAWWPGGRSPQNANGASRAASAPAIAQAPPAACSAAPYEPALAIVSGSNAPPPASETSRTAVTYGSGWTAVSASRSTSGAARSS
jgi:hypothetical protein